MCPLRSSATARSAPRSASAAAACSRCSASAACRAASSPANCWRSWSISLCRAAELAIASAWAGEEGAAGLACGKRLAPFSTAKSHAECQAAVRPIRRLASVPYKHWSSNMCSSLPAAPSGWRPWRLRRAAAPPQPAAVERGRPSVMKAEHQSLADRHSVHSAATGALIGSCSHYAAASLCMCCMCQASKNRSISPLAGPPAPPHARPPSAVRRRPGPPVASARCAQRPAAPAPEGGWEGVGGRVWVCTFLGSCSCPPVRPLEKPVARLPQQST